MKFNLKFALMIPAAALLIGTTACNSMTASEHDCSKCSKHSDKKEACGGHKKSGGKKESCGGHEQSDSTELKGRDIVKLGKIKEMTGTLAKSDHEWELEAGGQTYEMHMGPERYRDEIGIKLAIGKTATVKAFTYKTNMTPCSITIDGKTYNFRNKEGRPAWSGGGKGHGKKDEKGHSCDK